MAQYFFDTSAFAKYYHQERGSSTVEAIFNQPGRVVRLSNLGVPETESAFAMKVRSGQLSRLAAGAQRAKMMLDIAASVIEVVQLQPEHFRSAQLLIGRHGFSNRLRTLDALQLALAIDLRRIGLLDHFVVADQILSAVATAEGLPVIDPESHP